MAVFMFSLAGIPPMVGFYAKLAVLQALVSTNPPAYIVLAVFAVLLSLVGAFYYLRVVKVMYFDEPRRSAHRSCRPAAASARCWRSTARRCCCFGLLPGGLMAMCRDAIVKALTS